MKSKNIPRKIQAYLIIMGLFFGQVIGTGTMAISFVLLKDMGLSWLIWLLVTMGLYACWLGIAFKYKEDLAIWGLVDKPKKRKKE